MKEALIALLQQRMDKCTNEQFWAVASLTAADGFVISSWKQITASIPAWCILLAITCATIYGCCFIVGRHFAYYHSRGELARMLHDVDLAPKNLRRVPDSMSFNSLSGVVFYVGWIVAGCTLCFFVH
jgi:hypothetical protein